MAESEHIAQPDAAPMMGRREANKRAKLERIRRAAKTEFFKKGYEEATLRAIAADANVAFGTLFLYAKNKPDLLLLLFDEELDAVTERAFKRADPGAPVVNQLMEFFEEFYAFFCDTPDLSREMMREITFSDGIVGPRVWQAMRNTEDAVARLIARAQAEGQVSRDITPIHAAHVLFSLYRTEICFCLGEPELNVVESLRRLCKQVELVFRGLVPHADMKECRG